VVEQTAVFIPSSYRGHLLKVVNSWNAGIGLDAGFRFDTTPAVGAGVRCLRLLNH
jgi:hypothetical protein